MAKEQNEQPEGCDVGKYLTKLTALLESPDVPPSTKKVVMAAIDVAVSGLKAPGLSLEASDKIAPAQVGVGESIGQTLAETPPAVGVADGRIDDMTEHPFKPIDKPVPSSITEPYPEPDSRTESLKYLEYFTHRFGIEDKHTSGYERAKKIPPAEIERMQLILDAIKQELNSWEGKSQNSADDNLQRLAHLDSILKKFNPIVSFLSNFCGPDTRPRTQGLRSLCADMKNKISEQKFKERERYPEVKKHLDDVLTFWRQARTELEESSDHKEHFFTRFEKLIMDSNPGSFVSVAKGTGAHVYAIKAPERSGKSWYFVYDGASRDGSVSLLNLFASIHSSARLNTYELVKPASLPIDVEYNPRVDDLVAWDSGFFIQGQVKLRS